MPVYHQLQWTPEPPGEEYQRPIDGVKPEDHPKTYSLLQRFRCVITNVQGRIYQSTANSHKICNECYNLLPAEYKREYTRVASHNLVHANTARTQTRCTVCGEKIILVSPAHKCRDCIEEYLHADKALLRHGWGVKVVTRWRRPLN